MIFFLTIKGLSLRSFNPRELINLNLKYINKSWVWCKKERQK